MELFMRHPHRVFSRSDIVDHLWSVDNMPTEDTIKSHIRRIRLKLKKLGAEELIETLYGHGYRINPSFLRAASSEVAVSEEQAKELNLATEQIWQQIRDSVLKQVEELANVISNLTAASSNSETLHVAQKNAHQVAGTVGTFGYDAASYIARAIESLLEAPDPSQASLQQLVNVLRAELDHRA